MYTDSMTLSVFLIDLDDTLYPAASGLWPAIRERICQYMHERLGLPQDQVHDLRRRLYLEYGTTLRGLQATMQVDVDDYLAYVHDLPIEDYLSPDPELRRTLMAYPQRKYIFTNADRTHARRVMARLGVEDCFEGVIDVHDLEPYCKPMREAFAIAFQRAGEADPTRYLLADDTPHNLAAARDLGMFAVQVGDLTSNPDSFPRIARLADLPRVIPPTGQDGA